MADLERAKAAWAAAFAAWQSGYAEQAAPLAGLLADQASVPLDPSSVTGTGRAGALARLPIPARMSATWRLSLPGPQPQRRWAR